MTENNQADPNLEKIIMSRIMRINATVLGIVLGTIFGLAIFVSTIWLVVKGGDVVGPHLALLGQFYPGYQVTYIGSFIGLLYGFITGFIIGYAIAAIYNWILNLRENGK